MAPVFTLFCLGVTVPLLAFNDFVAQQMVITLALLLVALAQTYISCSLLSRMSSDSLLATQMEQERKILRRVLIVFSGSFFTGFITSGMMSVLTKIEGYDQIQSEICETHIDEWTGFMIFWSLMMDQIPFGIIFWFNIRSFK